MPKPPRNSDTLLFPAFLYGNLATCRRRTKAEAKKWAKCYKEHGDFPVPKMATVPAGSVIFCREGAVDMLEFGFTPAEPGWYDLSRGEHQATKPERWQAYFVEELRTETSMTLMLELPDRVIFWNAYEAFVCRYPWGALAVSLRHALYNTIDAVSRRLEALLSFWNILDTLRYIEFGNQPVPLAQVIHAHFDGAIAMWVDLPSGDVREDLRAAIDRMRRASEDEIRDRLAKHLRAMVDTMRNLKHPEWLKRPGVIEAELALYHAKFSIEYDDLTTGCYNSQGGFLNYIEWRNFPSE